MVAVFYFIKPQNCERKNSNVIQWRSTVKKRRHTEVTMKREDLIAIGLTDEQIERVMAENGKDGLSVSYEK